MPDPTLHLVLLETGGNQSYVFRTSRLRDVIGASELTYRAGTEFVLRALNKSFDDWERATDKAECLGGAAFNPLISDRNPIHLILLTSGKALALARSAEDAATFIFNVTKIALVEAPGLDLLGAFVDLGVGALEKITARKFNEKLGDLHCQYNQNRLARVDMLTRAPTFPGRLRCASSGLPAEVLHHLSGRISSPGAVCDGIAQEIWCKRIAVSAWRARSGQMLESNGTARYFPVDLEDLDQLPEVDWQAVVHADGNGLGAIFLGFHDACDGAVSADGYIATLRLFSYALDRAVVRAAKIAVSKLVTQRNGKDIVPFLPLVLGGDDLTAIVDGQQAIAFTVNFIQAYEQGMAADDDIKTIAGRYFKNRGETETKLTVCAGIAIVKPGYPFLAAYDLASELIKSAKTVKVHAKGHSAFDFHVLYDSTHTELDHIRRRLTLNDRTLTQKPIVLADPSPASGWCQGRCFVDLQAAMAAMTCTDEDGRRILPASQLHALRFALFESKASADAMFQRLRQRYEKAGLDQFGEASLFAVRASTLFLDALEASGFYSAATAQGVQP